MLLLFQGGSGPVTHATSGVLAGPGSVVVGSAARFRAHPTSGVLAGPGSVIVGSATRFRAHPSSGVLAGQGALVAGTAARVGASVTHSTTGDITGPGSTVAGSAARTRQHLSSGDLVGPGSVIVGRAYAGSPSKRPGAGNPRRRRWQAEKDGKVYEFDTVNEAQQFLQSVVQVEQKARKKKTFRLPDVEIFYDDIQVTHAVIENKPVIEWFFGHSLETLERALQAMDEDDIEVLILGL